MPRSDSETDLRLVLYGMLDISTDAEEGTVGARRRFGRSKKADSPQIARQKIVGKAGEATVD